MMLFFSCIALLHSCYGLSMKGLTLVGFYPFVSDLEYECLSWIPTVLCGSTANNTDDLLIGTSVGARRFSYLIRSRTALFNAEDTDDWG